MKSSMKRSTQAALACSAVVGLVLAGSWAPAFASDQASDISAVDQVAARVADVAPGGQTVAVSSETDSGFGSSARGADISVPRDVNSPVVIDASAGNTSIATSLSLPSGFVNGDGQKAKDGTIVYQDDDATADAMAVQTLEDGSTRVQTIIGSKDSKHEFAYSLAGFTPILNDEGEALFVSTDGSDIYVPVRNAWAIDANGKSVQTRYEVRGNELVQVVVPGADTAYPVVADPEWVWVGAGWGMKLTRSETSRVRDYAAAGSMCAIFTRGAPGLAIGCAVYAGYMQTQAGLAESDSPKTCLFLNVVPAPGSIWRVGC